MSFVKVLRHLKAESRWLSFLAESKTRYPNWWCHHYDWRKTAVKMSCSH